MVWLIILPIWTLLSLIFCIVDKIKNNSKIAIWISSILGICALNFIIMGFGVLCVTGFADENDFDPVCYYFTDQKHEIVIEERSYLLYDGAYIYQLTENNQTIPIGSIQTDDGARNQGNYKIQWNDDSIELTYHTFSSADNTNTQKIKLIAEDEK